MEPNNKDNLESQQDEKLEQKNHEPTENSPLDEAGFESFPFEGLTEAQKEEVIKIVAASKVAVPQKKLKLGSSAFIVLLVGSMIGGGIGLTAGNSLSQSLISSISNNGVIEVNGSEEINWLTAASVKATPSVVAVLAVSPGGDSSGSGIVYDTEGHIVTSAHLFQHSGFNITDVSAEIRFSNGEVVSAKLLSADLSLDLALLKLDEIPKTYELVPATWRDSEEVQVGEYVAAIGSPLDLYNSVTKGVISSTDRVIQLSRLTPEYSARLSLEPADVENTITVRVFQTDASINPGNSGGGLVDSEGNFIGLNAAISGSEGTRGLGFAIPSNNITRVMDNMIEKGSNANGLLGAVASNQLYNLDSYISFSTGALIVEVLEEGAAELAGIEKDFVVTSYQDKYNVSSSSDLVALIRSTNGGETVKISGYYLNDPSTIVDYQVKLGSAPNGY